ncbi:hypothetical protein HY251_12350 [bacterium]|nr:hypothetical protein [bacterium]
MSEKTRVEMLEEFVRAKPDDAFTRYGLAMELRRLGRHDDAVREFRTLLEKQERYVPAYLMFGQLLTTLGRVEDAKKVLAKGVSVAGSAGNEHAAGELQEALEQLA